MSKTQANQSNPKFIFFLIKMHFLLTNSNQQKNRNPQPVFMIFMKIKNTNIN